MKFDENLSLQSVCSDELSLLQERFDANLAYITQSSRVLSNEWSSNDFIGTGIPLSHRVANKYLKHKIWDNILLLGQSETVFVQFQNDENQ